MTRLNLTHKSSSVILILTSSVIIEKNKNQFLLFISFSYSTYCYCPWLLWSVAALLVCCHSVRHSLMSIVWCHINVVRVGAVWCHYVLCRLRCHDASSTLAWTNVLWQFLCTETVLWDFWFCANVVPFLAFSWNTAWENWSFIIQYPGIAVRKITRVVFYATFGHSMLNFSHRIVCTWVEAAAFGSGKIWHQRC